MRIDPKTIPLRPEEKLISAQLIRVKKPAQPLSAIAALQLLAGVKRPEDIGKNGPVKASAAFPDNQAIPELRSYEAVFGRDSLIVASLLFDQFPLLTRATVTRLAELQGVKHANSSEEEPGKIVHEARPPDDPITPFLVKTWGWKLPYYGTVDATPLFVSAAARYAKTHNPSFLQETFVGRDGETRTIGKAVDAALSWLKKKLDASPDGILESRRLNTKGGLVAQSWKDSPDAHHHADGSLVNFNASLSSIDVQAKTFDALHAAAELFPAQARGLLARAAKLQSALLEKFWVEDKRGGYFALGSERDKHGNLRPLNIRTSNMGHLLNSRLLDDNRFAHYRDEIVATLFSPQLLTRAGIRTLASHENRYRPYSYQNGSVWPWDTFWISLGLLRHGYSHEARDLWKRILNVIQETKRFPEMVCGDSDQPLIANRLIKVHDTKYNFENRIEQPPQEIQAWTVASVVAIEHLQPKYGRV